MVSVDLPKFNIKNCVRNCKQTHCLLQRFTKTMQAFFCHQISALKLFCFLFWFKDSKPRIFKLFYFSKLTGEIIKFYPFYYTLKSLFLFWLAESVQWIFKISACDVITAVYTIIMSRSRVIMSRMTAVHDF